MALERALFLRQQADLIRAQKNLKRSAELVTQPGKMAEARDLMAMAALDLDAGDKKAKEGEEITNNLLQAGFTDIPLQTFAEILRVRPPVPGEGALARIVGARSQIEDELAIKETEAGLEQMREGNRGGFRASSQKAAEHSTRAEEIAITGSLLIKKVDDLSLQELSDNLFVTEPVASQDNDTNGAEGPTKPEQKEILKRGERVYITLRKALELDVHPDGTAATLDEVVYRTWEDKKGDETVATIVGKFRSTFRKDIAKGIELLRQEADLNKSLHPDIKPLFEKLKQDPKISALSETELEILCSRKVGWEAILAKLKSEMGSSDPEPGPSNLDIRNTPIKTILQNINNGELPNHEADSTPFPDFTSFQERIWWRAFDVAKSKDQVIGFKNVTFDDLLHDIYRKEISHTGQVPAARKRWAEAKIQELSQSFVLALDHMAMGLIIPPKIAGIMADFDKPVLEPFSWLTPSEITQVIKRELDFETIKEIAFERWSASVTPDQANAYLQEATGE